MVAMATSESLAPVSLVIEVRDLHQEVRKHHGNTPCTLIHVPSRSFTFVHVFSRFNKSLTGQSKTFPSGGKNSFRDKISRLFPSFDHSHPYM